MNCGLQDVNPLPESTQKAVEAALGKYVQYLDSFDEESEAYLKKKVENDLGSLLVQIKQRFSSTDPKWSKVSISSLLSLQWCLDDSTNLLQGSKYLSLEIVFHNKAK
jgi:hypothetical protein